jgi:uncharacterized protein YjlB
VAIEYLLLETGDRIILEDGTGFLRLEESGTFQYSWVMGSNVLIVPNQTERVAG